MCVVMLIDFNSEQGLRPILCAGVSESVGLNVSGSTRLDLLLVERGVAATILSLLPLVPLRVGDYPDHAVIVKSNGPGITHVSL